MRTKENIQKIIGDAVTHYPLLTVDHFAIVSISEQALYLIKKDKVVETFKVSTSKFGCGNCEGSNQTPLGAHRVRDKIGANAPLGTIFKSRENTNCIAEIVNTPTHTGHDYITTRILWLDGLEQDKNKGQGVDSYDRYIYLHGTHEEGLLGQPASAGCVRMSNADIVKVFDTLNEDSLVLITT